jgi:hypothetical protein
LHAIRIACAIAALLYAIAHYAIAHPVVPQAPTAAPALGRLASGRP